MSRVKVNVGISYVPVGDTAEIRAEPGDIIDNLRPSDLAWMLNDSVVEKIDEPTVIKGKASK